MKLNFLPMLALGLATMFVGCQKESSVISDEGVTSGILSTAKTASTCGTCVNAWTDTRETTSYNFKNLSLVTEHNATGITYLHLVRNPGTFTNLSYIVTFTDVSTGTITTLLSQVDANAGGGAMSDRDLLKSKSGAALSIQNFPANWEACDYITVKFTRVDGVGFGNQGSISVNYYLASLCPPEPVCIAVQSGITAYGGNGSGPTGVQNGGSNSAWWYYFDVNGASTQTIYANRTEVAGTITYTNNSFVINLANGWYLASGNESVKITGFTTIPVGRPTPGQSPIKSGSTTVSLGSYVYPYYAVHLDLEKCTAWE